MAARPGSRGVRGAADEPRRRGRHLGSPRWLTWRRPRRRSTRCGRAAGATWSRPAPAIHGLAPELRRARRRRRARGPLDRAGRGARRVLPRGRRRRPRARRAPRPPARHPALGSGAGRPGRGRARRRGRRSGSSALVVVSPTLAAVRRRRRFLVLAYNLELFGGRFHNDFWFAAAWGAFPALDGLLGERAWDPLVGEAVAGAGVTAALLLAQRRAAPAVHARCASCAGGRSR